MNKKGNISRVQAYKASRNEAVIKEFSAQEGPIAPIVEKIAIRHNVSVFTIRLILTKAGLIGKSQPV